MTFARAVLRRPDAFRVIRGFRYPRTLIQVGSGSSGSVRVLLQREPITALFFDVCLI